MNAKGWAISTLVLAMGVSACGATGTSSSSVPTTVRATPSVVVQQGSSATAPSSTTAEVATSATNSIQTSSTSSAAASNSAPTSTALANSVSSNQSSQVAAVNSALNQIDSQINNLSNTQSAGDGDIANSSNGN